MWGFVRGGKGRRVRGSGVVAPEDDSRSASAAGIAGKSRRGVGGSGLAQYSPGALYGVVDLELVEEMLCSCVMESS